MVLLNTVTSLSEETKSMPYVKQKKKNAWNVDRILLNSRANDGNYGKPNGHSIQSKNGRLYHSISNISAPKNMGLTLKNQLDDMKRLE